MWCALSQPVGYAVWNTTVTVTVFISVEYCGYSCMSRLYCSSYRSKNCWLKDLRQGRNHFPSKSVLTNQLAPFSFLNMFSGSTLGNHTFPTAAAKACNELQSTISLHHHCWHAANNSKLFSLMPYMTDLLMSVCELNWLCTRQMCHQQLIFSICDISAKSANTLAARSWSSCCMLLLSVDLTTAMVRWPVYRWGCLVNYSGSRMPLIDVYLDSSHVTTSSQH